MGLIIVLTSPMIFQTSFGGNGTHRIRFDELVAYLAQKQVTTADWGQNELSGKLKDGSLYSVSVPEKDTPGGAALIEKIEKSGASIMFHGPSPIELVLSVLSVLAFPLMVLAVIYILLIRPAQYRGAGAIRSIQLSGGEQIASFSGLSNFRTDMFTIPLGRCVSFEWSTSPEFVNGKRYEGTFHATLRSADNFDEPMLIAGVFGEGTGRTNFYRGGAFIVEVVADEPWSIKVFLV